ncbi:MAG: methyltransferase family protein, partial [Waddliaceae bacterium]
MNPDYPFHTLFLMYSLVMISYRAYYMGYVDASGETVPKLEEGLTLRRIRYSLGAPFILGGLLYLLNPGWMQWSQWEGLSDLLRWMGVIVLTGSAFLYGWTHRHLGKNFTDTVYVRKKSTLIHSGPYSWVRHPMYVSGMMAAVGISLATANWF